MLAEDQQGSIDITNLDTSKGRQDCFDEDYLIGRQRDHGYVPTKMTFMRQGWIEHNP